MFQRLRVFVLCVFALGVTHFFQLGNLPFFGSDEPRYARVGEEMWIRGDWVTPTLNFIPWLEKPPLLFWLESVSFRLFGVSEWAARLPVAVLSTLAILGCSWFLARLQSRRAGWICFVILTTAPLFFAFARAASTDAPLTVCLTLALLSAYLAARRGELPWSALSGLSVGLAGLAKGLVGPCLFAGILVLVSLLARKWIWNYRQTLLATSLSLAVVLPWGWLVWLENGYNFIATFFLNHHLARFLTSVHRHDQPIWFYLAVICLGFFPWAFFLGPSLVRVWKSRWQVAQDFESGAPSLELYLWVWITVPLVFFSLSASKLAGYILPTFPAMGMIASLEWDRVLKGESSAVRHMSKEMAALGAFAVLVTFTLIFGSFFAYGSFLHGAYLGTCVLTGTLLSLRAFKKRMPTRLFVTLAATMVVFAGLAYGVAAPTIGSFYSAKQLVLLARPHITEDHPLIFYRFFHHTALYYSDYRATPDSVTDIESLQDYMNEHPQKRYFILCKKDGLEDLRAEFKLSATTPGGDFFLVEITGEETGQ